MVSDIRLLHEILADSVVDNKVKIAVRCGDRSISYGDLEHLSNQLCYSLIKVGVSYRDRVGIYLDKSIESIIAIFGILKAGAAYVPLDTGAPTDRIAKITNDCMPTAIISSSSKIANLLDKIPFSCAVVIVDDKDVDDVDVEQKLADRRIVKWSDVLGCSVVHTANIIEEDLAYILYTSGSTGMPKGVMISHRASIVFVNWSYYEFKLLPGEVIANHAPLHFDLSIFDIFTTIKSGGTILLIPSTISLFPSNLTSLIVKEEINVWYSVPSILIKMILYGKMEQLNFSKLRLILFAGEVFPIKYLHLLMQLIPNAIYYNLYGPTETNVCSYYKVASDCSMEVIPIGKACPYNKLALLSNDKIKYIDTFTKGINSVDADITEGELCVRGPNVMTAYWRNLEATHTKKRQATVSDIGDDVLYCTGDWVKQDADGNIIYLGRIDNMIKSRGYRIELDEIESVLHRHPNIYRAAIVALPDLENTNLIKAFVVLHNSANNNDEVLDAKEVKSFCSKYLPRYMVPTFVEICKELPETQNGKIDKVKLKKLEQKKS